MYIWYSLANFATRTDRFCCHIHGAPAGQILLGVRSREGHFRTIPGIRARGRGERRIAHIGSVLGKGNNPRLEVDGRDGDRTDDGTGARGLLDFRDGGHVGGGDGRRPCCGAWGTDYWRCGIRGGCGRQIQRAAIWLPGGRLCWYGGIRLFRYFLSDRQQRRSLGRKREDYYCSCDPPNDRTDASSDSSCQQKHPRVRPCVLVVVVEFDLRELLV